LQPLFQNQNEKELDILEDSGIWTSTLEERMAAFERLHPVDAEITYSNTLTEIRNVMKRVEEGMHNIKKRYAIHDFKFNQYLPVFRNKI